MTSTATGTQAFFLDPSFWLVFVMVTVGIILGIIIIRVTIKAFLRSVREASIEKKSLGATIFEIRVPKDTEIDSQSADQMFSGLLGITEKFSWLDRQTKANSFISFEIVGLPEAIRFYVVCSKNLASTVEKVINGAYPNAEVGPTDEYNIFPDGHEVSFAGLKLDSDAYKPFRTYEEFNVDTISSILTSMSKLEIGESIAYQVVICGSGSDWRNDGKAYVRKIHDAMADPEKKSKPKVDESLLSAIEKKCEKGGFFVDIRLVSVAKDKEVAENMIDTVFRTFSQFNKEGSNQFKKIKYKGNEAKQFVKDFIYRTPRYSAVLNTAELATIYHFPNKNVETPHINWLLSKRAPATGGVPSQGDLWLGQNIFRETYKPVFINRDDRRRHMYIIGKTGAGKSWFIQQMALQDIIKGEGIAFLDPHGDSAQWLLERIPPHRIEDVIYWDPGDVDRPIGFNIIEYYDEQDKHRVVNSFLGLMQKMYDPHNQGITGPRFERAVRNAMLTVMEDEGSTLVEVLRILSDQKYANKKIPFIKDIQVKRYWTDEIANTQEFHKSEVLGYIVSKFDRFITNKLTRNIFGQAKSGFNMRRIMDDRKILIVNLSKGLIGEENAQFLGLLLVPRILSAAMSRADIPEDQRKDFYLYVDEFQNFSTEDFAQILSEARKYKLNLIVANQYIAQIDEKIRNAVFGNVGTVASMKVGSTDAQFLESIFLPTFNANDLVNLENTNAYIKLINKGESPAGFSINTHYKYAPFPIPKNGDLKTAEIVKNLSRFRYGRDKDLVEAEMMQRSETDSAPAVKGPGQPLGIGSAGPLTPPKPI
jgi:hypothetical protein